MLLTFLVLACASCADEGDTAPAEDGGAEDGGAEDGGAEDGGAEDGGAEDGGAEDGGAEDGGGLVDGGTDGGGTDGGGADGGGADGGGADGGTDGGGDGGAVTSGTRGVWAWRDAGDPHGTDAVVGDPAAEEAMVVALVAWGVDRVYGAYGERAATEPEVIAAWNVRLHDAGIQSHVLLGDPAWISSREWSAMEARIDARLLDFNASRFDPAERFDGLHLDIEPHAGDTWAEADAATRYAYLGLLADTYAFARGVLDDGGGAALPMAADLPVWYDKLPPELGGTGQVGWPSVAARDAWFVALGDHLGSISLMAYETPYEATIAANVADEVALFPGEVRVGLNEEVGTTWASIGELFAMAAALEVAGHPVDLHSYAAIAALK